MLLVSPVDEHESPPCDAQPDELDIAYASEFAMQASRWIANQAYRPQLGWFADICAGQHPSLALIPQCLVFCVPDRADMGFKCAGCQLAALIRGDENSTAQGFRFSAEGVPSRFL